MDEIAPTLEKLHAETATIRWHELQTFFAQGAVLYVDKSLDLIEIACQFANDQTEQLQPLIELGQISAPSNEQARQWYDADVLLWSVVVAPFVLVQNIENNLK